MAFRQYTIFEYYKSVTVAIEQHWCFLILSSTDVYDCEYEVMVDVTVIVWLSCRSEAGDVTKRLEFKFRDTGYGYLLWYFSETVATVVL